MAPVPKNNSIDHFTHPGHPLLPVDGGKMEFLCDGCKTLGTGKKHRCHVCDFDLHDYCATCPRHLSSFMHARHALTLVTRKASGSARRVDRVCDVCSESVEGLFYRCKDCEFDVHPLCTQLPERLKHALHDIHPLSLQSSPAAGACAVCGGSCLGWRYRCGTCKFDIHLECVLVPAVKCPGNSETGNRGIPVSDRRVPFQPPPQFAHYYSYGYPAGYSQYHFGPGYTMYGYNQSTHYEYVNRPGNFVPAAQNQVAAGASGNNGTGRVGKSMFSLVGQLGFGVLSNMIFGVDISSVFAG